jgi:WD40 repeat protein
MLIAKVQANRRTGATPPLPAFDAFISYRHDTRQAGIARALQHALHQFAKPWYRLRAVRLYRDETDLAAHPDLWSVIVQALDRSRYLLLIASPAAAGSPWVERELVHWLAHKGHQTLLIVVTDGVIEWDGRQRCFSPRSTALPPAVQKAFSNEPFWIDLSWISDVGREATLDNARFRNAVAAVSAALRGVDKDVLASEDAQHLRRRMRQAFAALGVIAVLAIGASLAAAGFLAKRNEAVQAQQLADVQRDAALLQESRALGVIAAKAFAEGNPQTAMLIAMEALPGPGGFGGTRPFSANAAAMLHTALAFNRETCLLLHGGPVKMAEFRVGGDQVVTASSDGAIRLWTCEQQAKPVVATMAHQEGVSAAGAGVDGKFLATASVKGEAKFWRIEDKGFVLLATVKVGDPINEVYVVGDGKKVILLTEPAESTERPRNAFLWDPQQSAQALMTLETSEMPISIYPSPDRRLAAIGPAHADDDNDNMLSVWDFSSVPARVLGSRHIDPGSLTTAAFDSKGQQLFVSHARFSSRILRVDAQLTELSRFASHDSKGITLSAAFDRTGTYLATGGQDGSLQLRYLKGGSEEEAEPQPLRTAGPDTESVSALAFDNQSGKLLSVEGNRATLWELDQFESSALGAVSISSGVLIGQVSFDPTGWKFITASSDGTARVWSSEESGLRQLVLEDRGVPVPDSDEMDSARFWLTAGARFVLGDDKPAAPELRIWNAGSGRAVYQEAHPKDAYLSEVESAHGAAGTTVVLGYREGQPLGVRVLKIASDAAIEKMDLPGSFSIVSEQGRHLSHDGGLLVTSDGTHKRDDSKSRHSLLVWNLRQPQVKPIPIPAQVSISTVIALSRDGRALFTGAAEEDATASGCLWRLGASPVACIAVSPGDKAALSAVAFNADGTLLAIADAERHVRLFNISAAPRLVDSVQLQDGPATALQFSAGGARLIINNQDPDTSERDSTFLWAYLRQPSSLTRLAGSRGEFDPNRLDGDHLFTGGEERMLLWNISLDVPVAAAIPNSSGLVAFGPDRAIVFGPNTAAENNVKVRIVSRVAVPDYATDLARVARKALVRCLTPVERVQYGLPAARTVQGAKALRQPDKDGGCK